MKFVAIYTRKSSKQDTKQANSHARQIADLESFCRANEFAIIKRFEDSMTGTLTTRPGWKKLVDWLSQDKDRIVVINSVSRMTRTMKVWYELEDLLPQFRFVETGRNVPNLTTVAVMSAVAKAESDAISSRVKSAYRLLKDKHGQDLRWGNPNVGNMSKMATEAKKEKMHAYWMDILIADAALYRNMGWNQKTRLAHLNRMGFRSRRGKELTRQSLIKAHARLDTGGVKVMGDELWPSGTPAKKN